MKVYFDTVIKPLSDDLDKILVSRKRKIPILFVPSETKYVKLKGFSRLFEKPF